MVVDRDGTRTHGEGAVPIDPEARTDMLAKVITLTHSTRGKGFGFVLRYILRCDAEAASPDPVLESGQINLPGEPLWSAAEDPKAYAEDVAAVLDGNVRQCHRRGRFHGNPVYHVAINWKEGEHPTAAQAERAATHVMQALGFEECQAVWSIHRDTDNDHVHLVINRVHPTKFTAIGVPRRDYLILDRCMRELELEFGLSRAQGPYVTVDTAEGPKIVRMSRKERQTRGLLQDPEGPRLTARAQRAEWNLKGDSFQRWITGAPAAALRQAVEKLGVTWQPVHDILAGFGCAIQPKGSGMVVTTTLSNGRVLAAKASVMGRWASKASLERALGPYVPVPRDVLKRPDLRRETYEKCLERERLEEREPRIVPDDPERLARRAARAAARAALVERFAREQAQNRTDRSRQHGELRKRHEEERRAFIASHRDQRRRVRAAARMQRRDGRIALSLWAFRAAAMREALQRRQAAERGKLTESLPRSEVWRRWLERQAAAGDEAANAALRGIRYREQRKRHRVDGIEGEEISRQRPLTVGTLRAEVDAARQVVIYRRADGAEVFRDTGPRIVMRDKGDESLEAALRVAAQKYGGRIQIMGSDAFRERAARMASRQSIAVDNTDLQGIVAEERRRMVEHWTEPQASQESQRPNDRGLARPRSRGPER